MKLRWQCIIIIIDYSGKLLTILFSVHIFHNVNLNADIHCYFTNIKMIISIFYLYVTEKRLPRFNLKRDEIGNSDYKTDR